MLSFWKKNIFNPKEYYKKEQSVWIKKYDSEIKEEKLLILDNPLLQQLDDPQLDDPQPLTEITINVIHSDFYKKFIFLFMLEKINNAAHDERGFVRRDGRFSYKYSHIWEIPVHSPGGSVLIDADYDEEIFSDSALKLLDEEDEQNTDYIFCKDYNVIRGDFKPITFRDIIKQYITVPHINSEQIINILALKCHSFKGINFIKKLIEEYPCIFNNFIEEGATTPLHSDIKLQLMNDEDFINKIYKKFIKFIGDKIYLLEKNLPDEILHSTMLGNQYDSTNTEFSMPKNFFKLNDTRCDEITKLTERLDTLQSSEPDILKLKIKDILKIKDYLTNGPIKVVIKQNKKS